MIVAEPLGLIPGYSPELTVSPETARRIAGFPSRSLLSPLDRYSGATLLVLAVLGALAVGGAVWMARSN